MADKKKPAFGGYNINFSKKSDVSIGEIMGKDNLAPSEMTKKIWAFVKKHNLSNKPKPPAHKALQTYWDETEYDDMDLKEMKSIMKEMGVKEKAMKVVATIFKKQEKNPDAFAEKIDEFVDEVVEASKAKTSKKSK